MEEQALDFSPLYEILDEYKTQHGAVIPVLQKAQEIYGWLPKEVLQTISRQMRVPLSQIYGVVTFYSQFYLQRRGRHIIRQCDGTAGNTLMMSFQPCSSMSLMPAPMAQFASMVKARLSPQ